MSARVCEIDGCAMKVRAKGLCITHYSRRRSSGDPLKFAGTKRFFSPADSIANHSVADGDCLVWQGKVNKYGYGLMKTGGKVRYVHQVAYELAKGPIPEGLVIDHLCFVRNCVNAKHLRAVTVQVNTLRRAGANPNNKSTGLRNVYRMPTGKFMVSLTVKRIKRYGGMFDDIHDAETAAQRLRSAYGA